jgi:peroxiredoxin
MMDPAARVLKIGESLPELTLPSVAHGTLSLKEHIRGAWSVVLFYRGSWCPFCNTQLTEFQRGIPVFEELGVRIVAISADSGEEARNTVARHYLTFPVLYRAVPAIVAKTFGVHIAINEHGTYIESTGFVVDPDGSIVVAVYSSGVTGRLVPELVPEEVFALIKVDQSRQTSPFAHWFEFQSFFD